MLLRPLLAGVAIVGIAPFFSSVRLYGRIDPTLMIAYVLLLGAVLGPCFVLRWIELRASPHAADSLAPRTAISFAFCMALVCAITAFLALPILLHHATSAPGVVTVTVSGKETAADRSKCEPRLRIKEFAMWSIRDELCPDPEIFEAAAVGDRVELEAKVSRYGLEPLSMRLIRNTAN